MVALGSLAKGRSSARPLLRQRRQAAAVQLACGIRLVLRYAPSQRNPVDGPSRGLPVGVAAETMAHHADREAPSTTGGGTGSPLGALLERARLARGFAGG
eukprot:1314608-Lingulodinium_polyedra.AAC.1